MRPEKQDTLYHLRASQPGGVVPVGDQRGMTDGEAGNEWNIVELFPDILPLHCRNTALAVDPAVGLLQNFIVGNWVLPFDCYIVAVKYELVLPNVAGCSTGYLRVGFVNVAIGMDVVGGLLASQDMFQSMISGTKGSKVRVLDAFMPYGRRAVKQQHILACLQVNCVAPNVAFNVEFDVQVRVLNLGSMTASGQ